MELDSHGSARKRKASRYAKHDTEHLNGVNNAPLKKPKTFSSLNTIVKVGDASNESLSKTTPKKLGRRTAEDAPKVDEERRLRRFRKHAPQSYLEVKGRALTQRLTVLNRERCGSEEVPEEEVVMAGSTGNVYKQHIGHIPSCDCPHARKGNQCKHIIYIMLRVLKAPENIGYQLALTSSELRDVFKNAAPIPAADAEAASSDGNRKPIEDECPICYCDFEATEKENIAYCKAGCGNNVHKDCMASWAAAKAGKATCPYCRAMWENDTLSGKANLQGATRNGDGYLNVASQLGLSGARDYSTYHQPWVRRDRDYRREYGHDYDE